jgi:carbamoyltransferase
MSSANVNVLGLCSTGHGAAAALVSSQFGVRALTLERFTGQKNSLLFTRRELSEIKSKSSKMDAAIHSAMAYSFNGFPPSFVIEDTLLPFVRHLLQGLPITPSDIDLVVTAECHFGFNWGRIGHLLESFFPNASVSRELEHHKIHQWQAYLPSRFTRAAILTADESGESLGRLDDSKIAMTLSVAEHLSIDVLKEHVHPQSSPGLLYGDFSRFLGFFAGEEGKTMGLAPYGRDVVYKRLRKDLKLFDDGSFAFLPSTELLTSIGKHAKRRQPGAPITPAHADIAYAGQMLLEEIMLNAAKALKQMRPDVTDLCIAGGVGLNSCANQKIAEQSKFRRIYIAPNPGDNGHALACALYGAHVVRKLPRKAIDTDYLGPNTNEDRALSTTLHCHGLKSQTVTASRVADLIQQGRVIGIYQGGAEHGPRALGNRSILADPRDARMSEIVNARVKHRELFRPFAPVVLVERARDWFTFENDTETESPFMLRVVRVRPDRREKLGAVTHIDGTARIQTLSRNTNPWLYEIIEAFEAQTGLPVLLNTSFNLAKKPIVETLEDALQCYLQTELDGLLIGRNLLLKSAPPSSRVAPPPADLQEYQQLVRYTEER